ncbi:MAG TPA: helix-turn-helix domain-containing protein [Acidobacteriaceae bacterium]|nr:helix-turn-helix domain-containing protein [Acidobacteriaceae bacterium]
MNSSTGKEGFGEEFKDWITHAEAARVRGVSQERIRKLAQQGRLQSAEVGGRKFVRRSEVESFIPLLGGRPRKESAPKKRAARKKKTAPKKSD